MNKKYTAKLLSLTTIISAAWLVSCSAKLKIAKQTTPVYLLNESGLVPCGVTNYYTIDDSIIPYKRIDDFVDLYFAFNPTYGMPEFKVVTQKNISIITNLSSNATAIIDYHKQTITYPDLTAYFNDSNRENVPVGCDFGGDQYFIGKVESERTTPQKCVISLADYNQHIYFIDGNGYIPETFMVQALVPMALFGTVFNGRECFVVDGLPGTDDAFNDALDYIRETATIFNQEFMQYNYDVLAFTIDFRFGLTGLTHVNRNPHAYELSHTFFKDGAYAALEKYKEGLCSTEVDKANDTMAAFCLDEMCDGGHTSYMCHDVLSTFEGSGMTLFMYMLCACGSHDAQEYENYYSLMTGSNMLEIRNDTKADPKIMTGDDEAKAGFAIYPSETNDGEKVAYLVFDSFISPDETGGPDSPSEIDSTNYYDNTISLVYWADKQLKANPGVKDIVIDLSCNGGGNAYTEQFIASWLCGGTSKLKLYNRHDKTLRTLVRHADINLDGVFDSNDYLSSDYNIYCLFSNGSFSCGNLLPCDLKDHAVPTLHLLGTKTGGGCCSVEPNHFNAIGGNLVISSLYTLCREEATVDNVVTVEDGVVGDFTKYPFETGDEENAPAKFFAVDAIISAILS